MADIRELHVVLGAGPLGQATARALLRRGHQVRLVNRRGAADAPAGAVVTAADLRDSAAVSAVTRGATAVYQCAQPHYHEWVSQFPALQAAVIDGIAASGAKLVVAENLYMYGPHAGPLTEDLPYHATTRKGAVRRRMAEAVLTAHQAGRLRATAGRGSDFFGPGVRDSSLGERVFAPALAGKTAQMIGALDVLHSYTYIDDFGEALAVLGERPEADGRAWHVPTAPAVTQRQIIDLIADHLGRPVGVSSMGRLALRLGGLFIPAARETVEMLYEFERPFVVDASAYAGVFGDHATPLPAALARTIAWYRQAAALAAPSSAA